MTLSATYLDIQQTWSSNKGNYYQLIQQVDNRTVFCLTHGFLFCLDWPLLNGVSIQIH